MSQNLSVSLSDIDAIAKGAALPVIMRDYDPAGSLFQAICTVESNDMASHPYLGHRVLDVIGPGRLQQIEIGQSIPASNMGNGYPRQLKIRKFGGKVVLPIEVFKSGGWAATVAMSTRQLSAQWAKNAIVEKDRFVAGMLLDGTLSAGSMTYFDNSFTGFPDPYAGKTYDNTAAFVTSGKPVLGTSTTYTNLTVSRTLSASNLQTTLATVEGTNAVDERGNPINVRSEFLVCGKDLEFTADTILNSALASGTANNDINVLRGRLTAVASPYLTAAGAWWLLNRQNILAVDSGAPIIEVEQEGQNVEISCVTYFGAAFQDWRGSYACNKAVS